MVLAVVWTLVGVILTGIVALAVDERAGRRSLEAALHADVRGARDETSEVRDELRTEIREVRDELRTEIREVRTELHEVSDEMGTQLRAVDLGVRHELRELHVELGRIAETQAVMNAQLVVLRTLAHTHDAT